jgi:hypothetical protein
LAAMPLPDRVICGYGGQYGCLDIGEDDALRALHPYVAG